LRRMVFPSDGVPSSTEGDNSIEERQESEKGRVPRFSIGIAVKLGLRMRADLPDTTETRGSGCWSIQGLQCSDSPLCILH
jgi:hypothetical protein